MPEARLPPGVPSRVRRHAVRVGIADGDRRDSSAARAELDPRSRALDGRAPAGAVAGAHATGTAPALGAHRVRSGVGARPRFLAPLRRSPPVLAEGARSGRAAQPAGAPEPFAGARR